MQLRLRTLRSLTNRLVVLVAGRRGRGDPLSLAPSCFHQLAWGEFLVVVAVLLAYRREDPPARGS